MSLPVDLLDRGLARFNESSNWARIYSRLSRAVVARTVRGRPAFGKADCDRPGDLPTGVEVPEGPWLSRLNVPVPAGAPALVPTAPIVGVGAPPVRFDTQTASQVAVVWRNAAIPASLTGSLSLVAWVHTSLGWVRAANGVVATLAPWTEWVIDVAHRRLALQVTAVNTVAVADFFVGIEL